MRASPGGLGAVSGIGPRVAGCVARFFAEAANRRLCNRLRAAGVRVDEPHSRMSAGKLANKTFVLTGALSGYTRDEARRLIEAEGGRVRDAVTGRTDAVVLGKRPGQKLAVARRLGIPTLDEPAFRRLVGPPRP